MSVSALRYVPGGRLVQAAGVLVLLLSAGASHAQDGTAPPMTSVLADPAAGARERTIDQQRMTVRLSFEPEKGLVHGVVTHVFTPLRPSLDSLYLDGPGITYERVLLNGRPVAHAVWPGGISIYPDQPLRWTQADSLQITYTAQPRRGLYFVGWNDPTGASRRQIWSQGQGPGNQGWVPLYDTPADKLVTETFITFDAAYEVLSNGERVAVMDNGDGTRTWHYRMTAPHASYLMMIGIGQYDVQETASSRGVPIRNYVYPDQTDHAEPTYGHSARMMDILEDETGVPYPWPSYAQIPVHDFLHGGMENTTASVLSDDYYVDARAALDKPSTTVVAHEMAHQWFGDAVTMASNEDVWLHESFATHYAKRVERALFGEDHYEWNRKIERDQALSDSATAVIPIHHTRAGLFVYYKGSLVLDMLRDVVGDEAFDAVIQRYLTAHAYGTVTTADLTQAFEQGLGLDLGWFFDEWIEHGGEPHFQVSYRAGQDADGEAFTELAVAQIQETGPLNGTFRMPVVVEVHYTDGTSSSERVWVDGRSTTVRVENPGAKAIDFVLFDPQDRVLKRLTFPRSLDELAAQALRAPHMIDRYDAVVALGERPVDETRAVLAEVFEREPFGQIRAEVVRQLNERLAGHALDEIRRTGPERVQDLAEDDKTGIVRVVLRDGKSIFREAAPERRAAIGGAQHLVAQPEFTHPEWVRDVVELVENEDVVVHLLEKPRLFDGDADRAVVLIGREVERGRPGGPAYSVVTAPYAVGGSVGAVAVLGPTRMDYARAVGLVEYVAGLLGEPAVD